MNCKKKKDLYENVYFVSAVKNLMKCGIQKGKLSTNFRLLGHRDVGQTECPGEALYKEIQKWPHYHHGDYENLHLNMHDVVQNWPLGIYSFHFYLDL